MSDINAPLKLIELKIKNKLFHTLKYYIINCYPPELKILNNTLNILEQKYPQTHYLYFIQQIKNCILSSSMSNVSKIESLINIIIDKNEIYDCELCNDIIQTLQI